MRISDWSSDVCSSDLLGARPAPPDRADRLRRADAHPDRAGNDRRAGAAQPPPRGAVRHRLFGRGDGCRFPRAHRPAQAVHARRARSRDCDRDGGRTRRLAAPRRRRIGLTRGAHADIAGAPRIIGTTSATALKSNDRYLARLIAVPLISTLMIAAMLLG